MDVHRFLHVDTLQDMVVESHKVASTAEKQDTIKLIFNTLHSMLTGKIYI